MSRQGGAGYQYLAGYVLNVEPEHQPADPASWTRLNAYILDIERHGEKVAWERASNCQADDPGWAVKEILATQARNTRSRTAKSYHLVVSFPDGEQPTRAQIEDIENRLCAALGFEEHQRVSAVHQNTDNWHLHVAINKVHPRTFRNFEPFRDHYRLQEACVELEIRHGLRRTPHTTELQGRGDSSKIKGRAADFEAQQGRPSFLRWVRDMAAPRLLAARDAGQGWRGLHHAAACFDLQIKPYGAGLVIDHRSDGRLHVKASNVDRGLSLKAVTDVLGPFQPPGHATSVPSVASYATPALSGPVFEAFKQERIAAAAARTAALGKLHEQHLAYTKRLSAYYRDRFHQERQAGVATRLKRDALQCIADQQRKDRTVTARREAYERRQVRVQHPIPTWQGYLEREAANGNEAALAALRDRLQHRAPIESQLLHAQDDNNARHIVYQYMRPTVRRDGRVIYRTPDGGVVSDEARSIHVKEVTAGALYLALLLAGDRFGQRPLTVKGTDDFRAQVAELAGIEGLNITFSDGSLEKQRALARHARRNSVERDRETGHSIYDASNITARQGRDK
jgi:Relaxase/Mobilisation nuclease domain/Large polyvalent protein-associated domain 7